MQSSELSARVPFVGRSRELEAFRAVLRRVADGAAGVVHISGEIGIGRTRLLQEFAALARAAGGICLLTRSAREDDVPLAPLLQAETSDQLPILQEALAEPADHPDYFARLLEAAAAESRQTPLWLLMDDLHAADEATRAFAERLVAAVHHGSLRERRVGVVFTTLSGGAFGGTPEGLDGADRRSAATRLPLGRLSVPEVRCWLELRFDTPVNDELALLLGEASGGNPLLLSELATYLQRTRALEESNGRVGISRERGADLTLPRDLASLVQGKLRSVSAECRRAMTLAAFLGNEFDCLALADLLEQDSVQLGRLIDEAADASLVERRRGHRVGFKHTSSRELLYAAPDRRSREETHLQVCEGLIGELGPQANENCLTIAHHLLGAGSRADPTLVLHFASRAADLAFRHHSYYLAGRYYEAAARAGRDALSDKELAALHCRAGEAFQRWSDGERSNACLAEAARLYEQCNDLVGYAEALQGLLRNLVAYGETGSDPSGTAARLQSLLGSLPEHCDELKVRVHDTLAAYYHHVARYDVAEAYAQTAMTIARHSEDPTLRCIPITSLALAQMDQLRLTDAKTTWLEGLSYDRAAGASHYEGLHLQRLPVPLYCLGEIQEAVRYSQASYRHNQAIGNTAELCLNLSVDVMIANLNGRFEEAIATGWDALELMASTRYLWSAPSLIGALAYALTMRQRFDEAESVIAHLSINGLTFQDTGPFRGTAARLRQLVSAHRDDAGAEMAPRRPEEAGRGLRGVRLGSLGRLCGEAELSLLQRRPERLSGIHDALEFVHRRGVVLALGWCFSIPRSLAVSTALRAGMSRASACFDEASRLAERANAPLEQGRVALYRALAALACDDGRPDDAQRDLSDALSCFERFDAPALAHLARNALSRVVALPGTH